MRYQDRRRDSRSFLVVDEESGIPTSVIESYQALPEDHGPLAQSDPRGLLLSMSEYNKPSTNFNVYDYNPATRAEQGQDYAAFAPHHAYPPGYVANQPSQVPSGLPQSAAAFTPSTPAQQYGAHDPAYYATQHPSYAGYVDATPAAPRSPPDVTSCLPRSGPVGTKITVQFRSVHDLELSSVTPVLLVGGRRSPTVLSKMQQPGPPFQYSLTAVMPPISPTASPTSQISLAMMLEDSAVGWRSQSSDLGHFSYVSPMSPYAVDPNAQQGQRKRKLDDDASPRRSPSKKPSLSNLSAGTNAISPALPVSPSFRRPSAAAAYPPTRRFSGGASLNPSQSPRLRATKSQHFYTTPAGAPPLPPLPASINLSWNKLANPQATTRSPSAAAMSAGTKSSLLPSPSSNPALVRTSTLQHSPTTPGVTISTTPHFNPYTMYPANAKAMLKIDGELNNMALKWTDEEWAVGRRLVQFRRSQQGSIITATFEAVTLEERIPNSICVSCIWWAEKQECFVTSVDTISLLESLVAVRFTVEEKNRIRRNLEGFRPLTVSKQKAESDDFFKLIMGFPNPKPRNIEKDVKVFPWRILSGALKKIIGKYSASYSSTAGALNALATPGRGPSDNGIDHHRPGASPRSTSSSATSHGQGYPTNMANAYHVHPGAPSGLGIATGPDMRLNMPLSATNQAASWHTPSAQYSHDMVPPVRAATAWDLNNAYLHPSPAMAMPNAAAGIGVAYSTPAPHYAQNVTALTTPAGHGGLPVNARFVPLHNYPGQSQQTSHA